MYYEKNNLNDLGQIKKRHKRQQPNNFMKNIMYPKINIEKNREIYKNSN
jgi:hypothetical protein